MSKVVQECVGGGLIVRFCTHPTTCHANDLSEHKTRRRRLGCNRSSIISGENESFPIIQLIIIQITQRSNFLPSLLPQQSDAAKSSEMLPNLHWLVLGGAILSIIIMRNPPRHLHVHHNNLHIFCILQIRLDGQLQWANCYAKFFAALIIYLKPTYVNVSMIMKNQSPNRMMSFFCQLLSLAALRIMSNEQPKSKNPCSLKRSRRRALVEWKKQIKENLKVVVVVVSNMWLSSGHIKIYPANEAKYRSQVREIHDLLLNMVSASPNILALTLAETMGDGDGEG